jgi:hypothetical protein
VAQRIRNALQSQGLFLLLIFTLSFFAAGGCGSSSGDNGGGVGSTSVPIVSSSHAVLEFTSISPQLGSKITADDIITITASYSVSGTRGEINAGWRDDIMSCIDDKLFSTNYVIPESYKVNDSGEVTFIFTPRMWGPCNWDMTEGPFDLHFKIETFDDSGIGKHNWYLSVASWHISGLPVIK